MNFLDEIVTYIIKQVQSVDSELDFYENDVFGLEDVSDFFADRYFKFYFNDTTFGESGGIDTESISCTLQLFSKRTVNTDREFRDIYCKALDVKNAVIDPKDIELEDFCTGISANSLNVEPLDSDDNTVVCTLQFNISRDLQF